MKKNILLIIVFCFAVMAQAAIIHTNTESLTLTNAADGSFTDFRWNWQGYDSEAIVLNLTGDITVSTTQLTFSVDGGTNMVPVGSYWAEVITYDDTSRPVYRTVAQGMINVNWSLFKDDDSYFEYYTNIHSLAASLIYYGSTSYPGNVTFSGAGVSGDGANFVFTGVGTGAVSSVFGRTDIVTAQESDYSAFYSLTNHTHVIADTTGLQAALDGKASTGDVGTVETDLAAHEALTGPNVHGLGTMSIIDDAPEDGSGYVRQDGVWTNVASASGYVTTNDWAATNTALQTQITSLQETVPMQRYSALTNQVSVLATSTGVTAVIDGTTVTLDIPSGVRVLSAVVRWNGATSTSFTLDTGTNDMANTALNDRWNALFQAVREDTGAFIAGASCRMDTSNHDEMEIMGLWSGGYNHCRFGF